MRVSRHIYTVSMLRPARTAEPRSLPYSLNPDFLYSFAATLFEEYTSRTIMLYLLFALLTTAFSIEVPMPFDL